MQYSYTWSYELQHACTFRELYGHIVRNDNIEICRAMCFENSEDTNMSIDNLRPTIQYGLSIITKSPYSTSNYIDNAHTFHNYQ